MKETTAERLQQAMKARGLRQADLLRLAEPFSRYYGIPLNRANISMYCAGKVEPAQDKLFLLACALGVSEPWLMGLDVPETRPADAQRIADAVVALAKLETSAQIVLADALKNPQTKSRLLSYAENLAAVSGSGTEGGGADG